MKLSSAACASAFTVEGIPLGGSVCEKGGRTMRTNNHARRVAAWGLVLFSLILGQLLVSSQTHRGAAATRRVEDGGEWRMVRTWFDQEPRASQSTASEDEATQARMKEIQVKLREAYDQVVMPRLKNAQYKCDPAKNDTKDLGTFEVAVSGAMSWVQSVEIFGFNIRSDELDRSTSSATEAELKERRRQMLREEGWTDQELQEMDASADDFKRKIESIWELVPRLLKENFEATFRCCMQTKYPTAYPRAMIAAARQVALIGGGDPTAILGENYMDRAAQCACAAGGTGWWGMITYKETFEEAKSWQTASVKGERSRKESYAATIDVRDRFDLSSGEAFDPAKEPINVWEGMASRRETYHSSGLKGCFKVINRSIALSGQEKGTSSFGVKFTTDGRYSVHYHLKAVGVSGQSMNSSRAVGCTAHNPPSSGSSPMEARINPTIPEIEGVADPRNPDILKGSKTVDIPVDEGKRTGTVTWHLFRCKKR
jgi:hypothetical protein